MKFKFYLIISILFFSLNVFSQKGKSGAGNINVANTKVNEFTSLSLNAPAGTATINVTASGLNSNSRFAATLAPGDLIMVIQMQGALIKLIPTPIWAPDSTYGTIYNYGTCGNYEFAEVKSVISGTQIEINCGLTYAYSNTGKTQIVRVPRYSSLNIAATGTLTTDPWNGSTGGVLAVEVDGNTTVNSGGLISANALGFRGGVPIGDAGTGNGNYATKNPNDGAEKGEGIGSDRLINSAATDDTLGKQCKGAPANGGGGGNANNCGGGGGGNAGNLTGYYGLGVPNTTYSTAFNLEFAGRASIISSGGGKGGYGTSTVNGNPTTNPPNNAFWGSFKRFNYGGYGGRPLDYSTGKIYMGGGGGSGHKSVGQSNGVNACGGGTGGGIIYILNYGTISGSGTISANGANGVNASGAPNFSNPVQGIDGSGGAGAGGTIILKSNGIISAVTTNANGGTGGNQIISGTLTNEGQGPGGGGSGGYIAGNGSVFTQNVNGGPNGVTNAVAFSSAFPMNGATSGNTGLNNQTIPTYTFITSSTSQTLCANQSTTVSASSTNSTATIQWYNSITGGNAVFTGTLYTTPTYTAAGTYTVYAGSCPGIYRLPIIITVNPGLTLSVANATACAGNSTLLTASGATTYTWNTGANTSTVSVSPASTTVYTVNGTSGTCTGMQTATVTINTTPTITVNSATICAGSNTILTASGATNYTWSTGATTNTISVSPAATTIYTVTGVNGICNSIKTTTVSVDNMTLTVTSTTICLGGSALLTASGAINYTWSTGANTNTISVSPLTTTVYTVAGTSGACSSTKTSTVTVSPSLSISVNSPTICAGQSALLTPTSSATSYTWSTGATTNTILVSPASTTVYTVTGVNGICTGLQTATVTVNAVPVITVNSATVCLGGNAVLTAGGATNYTWSTGANTNTISVAPTGTAVFTVTGANGACSSINTATVAVDNLTLTVTSVTICAGVNTILTAGGANTYTWSTGANTNTISVAPASTTVYTVSGTNGACSSTKTATVTVSSGLSISVNNTTICPGQSAVLTPTSAATSYTWSTGAITNTVSVSPASTTVYTVSGSNSVCTGIQTATVTVGSNITLTVNSATMCSGTNILLTANGANSYTWNTGAGTNTISVSPVTTTVYTVSGSIGTCSGTASSTVSVNAGPTLTLTSLPPNICTGQSTALSATGATTYTWSNLFSGSSQTVSPVATTIYSVTGTNSSGCVNTVPFTITINVSPTPTISVTSATVCSGQPATLTASGITTYTWNTGETTATINPSPNTTTTYTVSGSNGGCASNALTTVSVNSSPSLSVIASNTSGCSTVCVTFNDGSNSSNAITYQFGDGATGNTHNPSHCYTSVGSYTVSATTTDPVSGCSASYVSPAVITVTPRPVALFSVQEGTLVTQGSTIHLINNSTNAVSYIWQLCNTSSYTTSNVTTTAADTGKCCISLLVSSSSGCHDTVTNCIEILNNATINIPNVFTPNNDAKNDLFSIKTSGIKSLNCSIFDRWGIKMYEWDGINGYWDGKTRAGAAAVDGSYFYIINYTDIKDVSKTEKGSLSLFRN